MELNEDMLNNKKKVPMEIDISDVPSPDGDVPRNADINKEENVNISLNLEGSYTPIRSSSPVPVNGDSANPPDLPNSVNQIDVASVTDVENASDNSKPDVLDVAAASAPDNINQTDSDVASATDDACIPATAKTYVDLVKGPKPANQTVVDSTAEFKMAPDTVKPDVVGVANQADEGKQTEAVVARATDVDVAKQTDSANQTEVANLVDTGNQTDVDAERLGTPGYTKPSDVDVANQTDSANQSDSANQTDAANRTDTGNQTDVDVQSATDAAQPDDSANIPDTDVETALQDDVDVGVVNESSAAVPTDVGADIINDVASASNASYQTNPIEDVESAPNVNLSRGTDEPAVETVHNMPNVPLFSYGEDFRGMNPRDVIRRRAMPGSPEMRDYFDRLNEYNHEAFATNIMYVDLMRRQSQVELDTYVDYVQQEEVQRQARLEAAIMLFVFYIPPIWKRAIAELIDFFILLVIKLIVTFIILDSFNITTNIARMNITQWIDNPQIAAQLSTEVALLEIPFRIIVIIYETFFSVQFAGTPGKRWMGLRVLHVRELAVMDSDVLRPTAGPEATRNARTCVRINPAETLPFRFALMRAVLKNAFVGLLMSPVCFSFIFVNQNRTGYDVMTNSMVVEYKPNTDQEGPIWN